jgi:hypothetical protein
MNINDDYDDRLEMEAETNNHQNLFQITNPKTD